MAGDLKFIIGAVDNASATLAKVGKETEKLGASTAKMNAASRLIGAGAIVAFGVASVKAYADAEKSQIKLEEAYRKFPAIASVNISSMRALNDAIQAKTGTDNDDLAASEAKLAMYNLTGEQIQKLIPIVNDYAVANGIGVTEAAGKVGKAMMGNAKALKDIGINFKSTGDKAKDFQTIYDALNSKVGGAGEAFGAGTEGQLKILAASFQDLQEEVGAQLVPALKSLVSVATPLLGAFGKLPEPVKSATVMIAGAAAAALLLGPRLITLGTALQGLVPKAAEAAVALEGEAVAADAAAASTTAAATSAKAASASFGVILGAAAAAAGAVLALGKAASIVEQNLGGGAQSAESFGKSFQTGMSPEQMLKVKEAMNQVAGQSGILGVAVRGASGDVIGAAKDFFNAGDEIKNFDTALATMVSGGKAAMAADILNSMGISAEEAKAKLPGYADALAAAASTSGDLAGATGDATSEVATFTETVASSVDKTKLLADTASSLKGRLESLGGPAINLDDAMSKLYKSFDDATKAMKDLDGATNKSRTQLNLHTEAGRTAQEALAGIATAADGVVSAQIAAGASTKTITQTQKDARQAFIDAAHAAGVTGVGAAEKLADAYGLIPGQVATTIKVNALDMVKQAVLNYIANLNDIPAERRTQIITEYITEGSKPQHPSMGSTGTTGQGAGIATGGSINGPGSGTSDSIPAMLSNGEYVIKASSAARLGMGLLNDLNDNGQIDSQGRRKFGTGGAALLAHFVSSTNTAIAAEQELKKLKGDKFSLFSSTMASIGSSAALPSIFNIGAYKDAQANVASARQRLNLATTPQERASATAELDQAEAAARDSKPTAGNILKSMQAKLKQIQTFGANLSKLSKEKKLPVSLIRQLIAAGPEEGGALAEALLNGSAADYKAIISAAADTDKASFDIGQFEAGIVYDPLITKQRAKVQAALSKATHDRDLVVHTTLTVDGKALAEALVQYKRAIGGRKLGLD